MLCARALKSYKAALVRLLDGDMLGEESEANVLRQVGLWWLCVALVYCMVAFGGGDRWRLVVVIGGVW